MLALCAVALGTALVSACAFPVEAEMDRLEHVATYVEHYDHVVGPDNNLLDRALAACSDKTVKAETACVRQAVDAAVPSPQSLIALVPHCSAGQVCHYDHTTHDRLGFVEATATDFVKHWRIDLDFRHPAADGGHVPLTVFDRDDFDSVPAPPPPSAAAPRG